MSGLDIDLAKLKSTAYSQGEDKPNGSYSGRCSVFFCVVFAGIFVAMNHQSSLEPEASINLLLDAINDMAANNIRSWWSFCYIALLLMAFSAFELGFEGLCVSPLGDIASCALGEFLRHVFLIEVDQDPLLV